MKRSPSALLLLFCCVFLLKSFEGFTQDPNNLSPSDLNSVNIDELSDEQIQRFLDRAQESGLTLQQLELVAKQRGMSSTQIAKLRNRIRQIQLGTQEGEEEIVSPTDRLRQSAEEQEDEYSFFTFLNEVDSLDQSDRLEIFGMNIFKSSDIAFEPSLNVATPETYVLGAGDEIIIDVYGASEITYQEIISPDGNILISGIGPISLSGITLKEAKNRIFNKLSGIYSGVRGNNPNTFLQVTVGQVRSIKVNVVGNVVQPGTYNLSSFASAFNALYFAGGPTENGSFRQIEVYRLGERIAILDVYKYLFLGEDSQNPQLQDQDIVIVKPYVNRVKLAGKVKQPAIYELRDGETLDFLISFSGGFNEGAFKEFLTIDRVGDKERKVLTVKLENFVHAKLQNGDSLYVSKVLDTYTNRVKLNGAVNRPGYYELTNELSLSELINLADGLRKDAYLKRGNIIRLNDKLRLTNVTFDVEAVINGNQDILLSPDDRITIPSIFEIEDERTISIDGQVRNPGEYPFIDDMTVEDLINISGGLKDDATTIVEIARRLSSDEDLSRSSEIITLTIDKDLKVKPDGPGFKLKPFDLLLVKSTPYVRDHKVVRVEGQVNNPGYYALSSNEDKISDILERAGGLTQYGYAEGASLIRQTEYFRTQFEKEELKALVELKREEMEEKYLSENTSSSSEIHSFIEEEVVEYEKQLTEAFKIENPSNELEARIFRAQQLRKLLVRDSVSGSDELIERQAIGIDLVKILKNPGTGDDLILRDGDLISVPKKLETVQVQGEVLYPNTVRFSEGNGFKKYISAAGGFSTKAKVGKAYIVYANGSAKRTRSFLFFRSYPKVKPGADIIVPKREPKRKLSAQEVLGITSSLATMALIIDRLTN